MRSPSSKLYRMDITTTGKGRCRVLLVPGGPGLPPEFYSELIDGLSEITEVVSYEQRGGHPPDSDDYPRSVAGYAEELKEVITSLGREKPVILLGHSFGVPVAIEALLGESGAAGGILLNGFDSGAMLTRGLQKRREELPQEFQSRYSAAKGSGIGDIFPLLAEYFYPRHFFRLPTWPASFTNALAKLNGKIVAHFLGSDFFAPDGAIREWDRSDDLSRIRVPTLIVSGVHDYYGEEEFRRMAGELPAGELWISSEASHTPWVEDPEGFYPVLDRFLGRF